MYYRSSLCVESSLMASNEYWKNGWYQNCTHVPSPNFDERKYDENISLVVIHNISLPPFVYGQGAVQRLFTNQLSANEPDVFMRSLVDLRVSSHFLIERTGHLTQFVSCQHAAYHAGISCFGERHGCNAFSIGIELEGCDFEPFTDQQYIQLIDLLKQICINYPIETITGHQHIAPTRKTDPGHFFDWARLRQYKLPVCTKNQFCKPMIGTV